MSGGKRKAQTQKKNNKYVKQRARTEANLKRKKEKYAKGN
jgi:hypothetical protein